MSITRRAFLGSLLAAPFIARADLLMPVRSIVPALPAFLRGDQVDTLPGAWKACGASFGGIVVRTEGSDVIVVGGTYYGDDRDRRRIPRQWVRLCEGLPGNRVNNPSMRHRLVRRPGAVALAYPEDMAA